MNSIQMKPSCIFNVPLQSYDDFYFIVNDQKFKTTRLIADLISPIISQIHTNDPTCDTFTIRTTEKGNFSRILDLTNFNKNQFPDDDLPFILEVIEQLGNESIECQIQSTEITNENIFSILQFHEKHEKFFKESFIEEIDFTSSHFYELLNEQEEEFDKISIGTLSRIINNDNLQLDNEDQLLKFVNKLYEKNSEFSIFYDSILFANVSSETMNEFISIFDSNDLSQSTWIQLSKRLVQEIEQKKELKEEIAQIMKKRYSFLEFLPKKIYEFDGIINYLSLISNGKIENEINVTASSVYSESYDPFNAIKYNNSNYFKSGNSSGSWICFDFKEHKVIPTNYKIKSIDASANSCHPKSWKIQGSNDKNNWENLHETYNDSYLNGHKAVRMYPINNEQLKEFRFIRMKITNKNWNDTNSLAVNSFEIYGELI